MTLNKQIYALIIFLFMNLWIPLSFAFQTHFLIMKYVVIIRISSKLQSRSKKACSMPERIFAASSSPSEHQIPLHL